MAFNKSDYLINVLETHKMARIEPLINKYKTVREEVRTALKEHFGERMYYPFDSGSLKKHTAINTKFDLDLVAPFKKNAFGTLQEMFEELHNFLSNKYSDMAVVREQKVSLGVVFFEDQEGDILSIDIIPGRELNLDQYPESRSLNLFVKSQYGLLEKSTYIQTNIHSQIDYIEAKKEEREVIRLLKIWKSYNSEPYKSFLIELITLKAFQKTNITGNSWEKLKSVMEYIRDNVIKEDFKLIDPGNSNNDVMETLEVFERYNLSDRMKTMITRIEENGENIKFYFPLNQEFEDEISSEATYGIKGPVISPSIPPTNQRFG